MARDRTTGLLVETCIEMVSNIKCLALNSGKSVFRVTGEQSPLHPRWGYDASAAPQ